MDANDILNSPEIAELLDKAKWLAMMTLVKNPEFIDNVGENASQQIYEFLKVFYDHHVESDVVVEALSKIKPLQEQSKEDISSSDLTSFVKVLNDIQKKIGNFNIAAREVFEAYCSGKDLTPKKNQNLYSGKIVVIDTKHEDNKNTFGTVIYDVIDGLIPELCLLTVNKDLRIEKNMTCSDLYKRVIDMYFYYTGSGFDKIMYTRSRQ